MRSNESLVKKADMAIGDLATAGLLNPEQTNRFLRTLIDSPTILNVCRVVTMTSPTRKINKIGFGSRIMRKATSATALDSSDRSKPDLSQIVLNTDEAIAEVRIPYDVFEDNIEGGNPFVPMGASAGGLMDTIITLIGERAALDLEEYALHGDTANPDPYLAMGDGWLKLADQHIVDASGATISKSVTKSVAKAMPDKYLRNRSALKHFVSVDNETEYRDTYANRNTALGDSMLQGTSPVFTWGSEIVGVPMMPNNRGLFTDPLNLIFGIQRRVTLEYDKDITARVFIIVLTCRIAMEIEEHDALVKTTNLG